MSAKGDTDPVEGSVTYHQVFRLPASQPARPLRPPLASAIIPCQPASLSDATTTGWPASAGRSSRLPQLSPAGWPPRPPQPHLTVAGQPPCPRQPAGGPEVWPAPAGDWLRPRPASTSSRNQFRPAGLGLDLEPEHPTSQPPPRALLTVSTAASVLVLNTSVSVAVHLKNPKKEEGDD